MTTAQQYITSTLSDHGLPECAITAHPTQAGRYQIIPASPLMADNLSLVSRLFDDVTPYDNGAEITVPAQYPPAPTTAADRNWLTKESTLERRLEQVLVDHKLIDNVVSITTNWLSGQATFGVKFAGVSPNPPVGMKRADLTQSGVIELKVGSARGLWQVRVSDQWRIDQAAGDLLRQRDADVRDLEARLAAALSAVEQATDANATLAGKMATIRAERDALRGERDQLEAQITAPAIPRWAPLRGEIGYTVPAGARLELAVSIEHLNQLLATGGRLIGQQEYDFTSNSTLRALVEMRGSKAVRLSAIASRVTIVARNRSYTMRRDDRIDRDNDEVIQAIRAVKPSPRTGYPSLIGGAE